MPNVKICTADFHQNFRPIFLARTTSILRRYLWEEKVTEFSFNFPLKPVAKERPRKGKWGIFYTPSKTKQAEWEIKQLLMTQLPKGHQPIKNKPVALEAVFYIQKPKSSPKSLLYPIRRPDLDNYLKLLSDAFNGILYHDDAQIVELRLFKSFTDKLPQVNVVVRILKG